MMKYITGSFLYFFTCSALYSLPIPGICPREFFYGRKGAKRLLQGDWKYWGSLALDVEQTVFSQADSALYFGMRGQIRLDRLRFASRSG